MHKPRPLGVEGYQCSGRRDSSGKWAEGYQWAVEDGIGVGGGGGIAVGGGGGITVGGVWRNASAVKIKKQRNKK